MRVIRPHIANMTEPAHKRKADRRQFHFSIESEPFYPHIKLTREPFPRLLSTRKITDDRAEYFGPFLTRSSARILIDFLNQTFRLRTCFIEIDGEFEVPCTQYYAKRCVGPCVKSLCSREQYLEIVELACFFLRNDRDIFRSEIRRLIEKAADDLDFERAAFLRDIMDRVGGYWRNSRPVWPGGEVDTLALEADGDEVRVYLVTTRGRRMIGSRVFTFPAFPGVEPQQALADVIEQFYVVHVPREIRVSHDFADRRHLSRELSDKFGCVVRISALGAHAAHITATKALVRAKLGAELESIKPKMSLPEIRRELKTLFGIPKDPLRIEAFDAAHISGSGLVAAMSVWQNGEFLTAEYEHGFSDQQSELATLSEFIAQRFAAPDNPLPNLVVVDGGKSHLNAALEALGTFSDRRFSVIGAVKPKGRHSEISHFVLENGSRLDFDQDNEAMRILKVLRDDAHDLANATHRLNRDMGYYYELAGILPSLNERERQRLFVKFGSIKRIVDINEADIRAALGDESLPKILHDLENYKLGKAVKIQPLIVPIRYDDPDGDAGDLRPIKSVN